MRVDSGFVLSFGMLRSSPTSPKSLCCRRLLFSPTDPDLCRSMAEWSAAAADDEVCGGVVWAGDGVVVGVGVEVVVVVVVVVDASLLCDSRRCTLGSLLGGERPEADAGRFTPVFISSSTPSSVALFCRSSNASATRGTLPMESAFPALPPGHSPPSVPGPDEALILVASLSTMADRDPFLPRAAPATAALPPAADEETAALEMDDDDAEDTNEDDDVADDKAVEDDFVDAVDDKVCGVRGPMAQLEPREELVGFAALLGPAPDLAAGPAATDADDDTIPTLGTLRPTLLVAVFTLAGTAFAVVFILLALAPLFTELPPFAPLLAALGPPAPPAATLLAAAFPPLTPPLLAAPAFLTEMPGEVCCAPGITALDVRDAETTVLDDVLPEVSCLPEVGVAVGTLLAWGAATETEAEADWEDAGEAPAVPQPLLEDGLGTELLPPAPLFEF